MILSLNTNETLSIIWAVFAVAMIIIELNTVQLVSIWFAVAGFVAMLLAIFKVNITIQIIAFVLIAVILLVFTAPLMKKLNSRKQNIEGTVEGVSEEVVTVLKTVSAEEVGLVQARFEKYSAISADGSIFLEGEKAKIVDIKGNKVLIKKIKEKEND